MSDQAADKPPAKPLTKRLIALLAGCAAGLALAVGVRTYLGYTPLPSFSGRDAAPTAAAAAVGGPFALVDQNGRTVTENDFRGRYMLAFFGYTYCPDVCPATLTHLTQALESLGPKADKVVPVFVTVDPARDTPEHLKEYASFFHPRLLALTGSPEQVAAAAKAFRVYYAKVPAKDGDADDYLMDHTGIVYLMGPDGKFVTHFSHTTAPEVLARRLNELL